MLHSPLFAFPLTVLGFGQCLCVVVNQDQCMYSKTVYVSYVLAAAQRDSVWVLYDSRLRPPP